MDQLLLRRTALALLATTFLGAVTTAGVPSPYLHLSFDKGLATDGAGKLKLQVQSGRKPGAVKFVPGVRGQGVVLGERLVLKADGLVPAPEGSMSIWVKPLDWQRKKGVPYFLRTFLSDGTASAECMLYQYIRRTFWYEGWRTKGRRAPAVQMWGNLPWEAWENGKWRMLTVVWRKGERRIYMDDCLAAQGKDVIRNPTRSGNHLGLWPDQRVVDELCIWDVPISSADVAAWFYAQRAQSGLEPCVQHVPLLATAPSLSGPDRDDQWRSAALISTWCGSLDAGAVAGGDRLWVGHRDGRLYLRYREPMPADYQAQKTLHGGSLLRRSVYKDDGDVTLDDAVEVLLTPDRGQTRYLFGVSASGALRDAKNGDAAFNSRYWQVDQSADAEFWTVRMCVALDALSETPVARWGFNLIRTVRQRGYTKRQWSHRPGDPAGWGTLVMCTENVTPVSADMDWSRLKRELTVKSHAAPEGSGTIEYGIVPLVHTRLFPDDKVLNNLITRAKQDKTCAAQQEALPVAKLAGKQALSYSGDRVGRAWVAVKDTKGQTIASRSFLVSGSSPVGLTLVNLPSHGRVIAQVRLASRSFVSEDVSARLTVTDAEGKAHVAKEVHGFDDITGQVAFEMARMPEGPYRVEARVTRSGRLLGTAMAKGFRSGPPEWLGNDIGVIKSVPKPWTPMRAVSREALEVLGRQYGFRDSLLPASVKVLGKDVLAGPMRLVVRAGATTLDTSQSTSPRIEAIDSGVRTRLTGRVGTERLRIEFEGEFEFDGFGWYRIRLVPGDRVTVDRITFAVPFKKAHAQLIDDSNYNMFRTSSGPLPAAGAKLPYRRTLRVGDSRRGVQFAPLWRRTPPNRFRCTTKTPLEFSPEGESMVMRLTISDQPMTIDRPVTLELGVMATPVKPYDRVRVRKTYNGGHHRMRPSMGPLMKQGYSLCQYWDSGWAFFRGKYPGYESRYYNFTPEWCEAFAKRRKKDWDSWHHYYALYLSPIMIVADTPEYAYFQDEWRVMPRQAHLDLSDSLRELSDFKGMASNPAGSRFGHCCWGSRSYQDYYFYCLDKVLSAMARQGVRCGVYVDNTDGFSCANPHHGHGYVDENGVHQARFPFRGCRRWTQRLHQVVRKHSPDAQIVIHQSGSRNMGRWGMVDSLVEGEQFTANWYNHIANRPELTANDCYPQVLPLERVRASFAARLWGPQHVFLTQFWTDPRQNEKEYYDKHKRRAPSYQRRMRHLAGLMRVHDTPLWGEFMWPVDAGPDGLWFRLAKWGFDETVEFVPYWDTRGMVQLISDDPKHVVASAWYRPDGKLLVMAFNDRDNSVAATLTVHPDRFPVKLRPLRRATDLASPDPILDPGKREPDRYACEGATLRLDLRARDYQLIAFGD